MARIRWWSRGGGSGHPSPLWPCPPRIAHRRSPKHRARHCHQRKAGQRSQHLQRHGSILEVGPKHSFHQPNRYPSAERHRQNGCPQRAPIQATKPGVMTAPSQDSPETKAHRGRHHQHQPPNQRQRNPIVPERTRRIPHPGPREPNRRTSDQRARDHRRPNPPAHDAVYGIHESVRQGRPQPLTRRVANRQKSTTPPSHAARCRQ